jgi:hypothetical protein
MTKHKIKIILLLHNFDSSLRYALKQTLEIGLKNLMMSGNVRTLIGKINGWDMKMKIVLALKWIT